jgi:hypothetical protein
MPTVPKIRYTRKAIDKIIKKEVRRDLLPVFNVTEGQLIRKIKANQINGPLTTLAAVTVIERLTKLKRGELLEDTGK